MVQFHQHFTCAFFANIFVPKNYKAKMYLEKNCAKHFHEKKNCTSNVDEINIIFLSARKNNKEDVFALTILPLSQLPTNTSSDRKQKYTLSLKINNFLSQQAHLTKLTN